MTRPHTSSLAAVVLSCLSGSILSLNSGPASTRVASVTCRGVCSANESVKAAVVARPTLTLDGANAVLIAAIAEARKREAGSAVAVVDDGGNLLALQRLDGTFAAGSAVSIGKARTAALFKKPTGVFEQAIKDGRVALTAVSEMTPLQGGVPILVDGQVVGAVGVSGAHSAAEDEQIAIAGAAAVVDSMATSTSAESASLPVTQIQRAAVSDAFAGGAVLIDAPRLAVHASRRDAPGQAEVHDGETDVFYVLDGEATLITGGTVVDPQIVSPGQIRGAAINGGDRRALSRGDVIVIPAGVPHWFQSVSSPVTYLAVKVKGDYSTTP